MFSLVQGQKRAAAVLEGLLRTKRIPPSLLFFGLEGTGKTLLALEFAKALLCRGRADPAAAACGLCEDCAAVSRNTHPDVIRVNEQYQALVLEEEEAKQKVLKVETIRHLRHDMELRSLLGGWRVAIIEQAHWLNEASANALLKILEEPNASVLWILVTSRKEALPKTILSRCFSVSFAPLAESVVLRLLEGRGLLPDRAAEAAALCEGSVSRALELASGDYPGSLIAGPLSPLTAADGLPKELPLARTKAELGLFALAQDLRLKHLKGELRFADVEGPLRELSSLRKALQANADPKNVLTLACLEAMDAVPTGRTS